MTDTQKPTEAVGAKNAIANAICSNRAVDNWMACQADFDVAAYIIAELSSAGFVIVPREPTNSMLAAWNNPNSEMKLIYRAMIAATEKDG